MTKHGGSTNQSINEALAPAFRWRRARPPTAARTFGGPKRGALISYIRLVGGPKGLWAQQDKPIWVGRLKATCGPVGRPTIRQLALAPMSPCRRPPSLKWPINYRSQWANLFTLPLAGWRPETEGQWGRSLGVSGRPSLVAACRSLARPAREPRPPAEGPIKFPAPSGQLRPSAC